MEAVDFVAELADLLGKSGQVRVRACPLLLARGPLSEQVLFLLAQRRGPLILLGVDGGVPVAQYLLDPLVQLASVGPGALLDCRQPRAERVEGAAICGASPGSLGSTGELSGSLPERPCSTWITCWRTRFKSPPSFTSTWAATPSPSRMRPSRMCSVPM